MDKNNLLIVSRVKPNSIAEEMDINPGDKIYKINGVYVRDIVDYYFLVSDEYIETEIIKSGTGDMWKLNIEKDIEEELGVEFKKDIPGGVRRCQNNCLYCFIDQLPGGLRDSLYIKDDDYRYSFLYGSYISLTNLSEQDMQRIAKMRISPLYISVQATNPEVRKKMYGNEKAGEIMNQLIFLYESGITMHTQVVVCPGINDGTELEKTLKDLAELYSSVHSVAVVPVGVTGHGKKVYPVDKNKAREIVSQVEEYQEDFKLKMGTNFAFLADEFYLKAGKEIPPASYYEDYPQIENGVGLVRTFIDELESLEKTIPHSLEQSKKILLITGAGAGQILRKAAELLNNKVEGLNVDVLLVKNRFFGNRATVAGLLTGRDIADALKLYKREAGQKGEMITGLLPSVMFKFGEEQFLDGLTLNDVEKETGTELKIVRTSASGLLSGIFNRKVVV